MSKCSYALRYASAALKADAGLVRFAVAKCGWALEYASAALRASRSLVLAAVEHAGTALYFASDAVKRDLGVVEVALRNDATALRYCPLELRQTDLGLLALAAGASPDGRAVVTKWAVGPVLGGGRALSVMRAMMQRRAAFALALGPALDGRSACSGSGCHLARLLVERDRETSAAWLRRIMALCDVPWDDELLARLRAAAKAERA